MEPQYEVDGTTALSRVEAQLAFGFRIPGTDAHRRTGDWIDSILRGFADTVVIQEWEHETRFGTTVPMRNLIARFRPEATERVLYAGHWDSQPLATGPNSPDSTAPTPGASNNAAGVAVLLAVAEALHARPTARIGVDLLFTDGEDFGDFAEDADVLVGSTYYAAHPVAEQPPFFAVVFDMVGDADLQLFQEGNSMTGAPDVVHRVWDAAAELGYDSYFIQSPKYNIIDDHRPLQRAGIRAILVIDFDYPYWDSTEDTLDKISAESLAIVGNTAVHVVRVVDR